MYIEDIYSAVLRPSNGIVRDMKPNDYYTLSSIWPTVKKGTHSDRQAGLAIKILLKYIDAIERKIPEAANLLETELWLNTPIDTTSTWSITVVGDEVIVRFPYTEDVSHDVRQFSLSRWDKEKHAWAFVLSEYSLSYIVKLSEKYDKFVCCDKFVQLKQQAVVIESNPLQYIPCVEVTGDGYVVHNPPPGFVFDRDTPAGIFNARKYGMVVTYDDAAVKEYGAINVIVSNYDVHCWVDRSIFGDHRCLSDVIKYYGNIVFIVPGGVEFEYVSEWVELILELGFSKDTISVLFNSRSMTHNISSYLHESKLPSDISKNTKFVFLRNGVDTRLLKSEFNIDLVLNLGNHIYTNQHLKTLVNSSNKTIHYTATSPSSKYNTI